MCEFLVICDHYGTKYGNIEKSVEDLVGVLTVEDAEQSHRDDLKIERETPVAEVIKIVFHALGDRGIAAPTIDLDPACDPGLEGVAEIVAVEFLQKLFNEVGAFWPGAYDTHIALQHVDELGELVEIGFT